MNYQDDQELKNLLMIERIFATVWDLEQVKLRSIELVCSIMHAESASVILFDQAKNAFYFEVAVGPKGEMVKKITFPYTKQSIAKKVFDTGRTHIIRKDDPSSRSSHLPDIDRETHHKTENLICALIQSGDEKFGVLQVLNKQTGDFDGRDKRLCEVLGVLIGQAIKISYLVTELDTIEKRKIPA
jgi:transcriptional regulator with GAF, ATPase, and Fis domain